MPAPGRIVDMKNNNEILVSCNGTIDDFIIKHGPHKGKISDFGFITTNRVLKIDDKILKLIYNLK